MTSERYLRLNVWFSGSRKHIPMRSTRLLHSLFFLLLVSALSGQGIVSTLLLEEAVERLVLPPIASSQTFRLQNVVVGQRYAIQLSGYDQQAYRISQLSGGQLLQENDFFLEFNAANEEPSFTLTRRTGWNQQDAFRLSIANLTKLDDNRQARSGRSSPIIVDRNNNAQQLVDAIFRNNACFNTSDQVFTGVSGYWPPAGDTLSQLGTFRNGGTSIGIDEGVVLTNGRTSEIGQANTSSIAGYSYSFLPSTIQDPDLLTLSGEVPLYDVTILEFDFTPTTDFINFDYVFASDEYCELQNIFNDVFAFLISGPGINGPFSNSAENIAILADGTPITTRAINDDNNTEFFRSNRPLVGDDICGTLPPVALDAIEFDGFTIPLTASSSVVPCETYHLKLILADVNDSFIHSAVFFQRGSFVAGLVNSEAPAATAENDGATNAPLEGCSDGYIVLSRVDSNTTEDVTVYFNISPASTATFGVDYIMPTDSFIIPAGQLSDTLFITIFPDDEVEGTESIILQIIGSCSCEQNQAILYIVDPPGIQLEVADAGTDCAGTSLEVAPTVIGGVGDYRFQWSDGSTDSLAVFTRMAGEQTYYLSVTDNCQQTVVDSVSIRAPDISASLAGNYSLCTSPTASVPILLSGGTTYTVTITENGIPRSITISHSDTLWLDYSIATSIMLDSVFADGCAGSVQGSAVVSNGLFDVQAELSNINCFGDISGAISVDVNGQPENYTFQWEQVGLNGANPQQLTAGSYNLRIIDSVGCFFDTTFLLSQPDQALRIDTLAITPQDCRQAASLSVAIGGGTLPYTFSWSDGNDSDLNRENLPGGQVYTLQVSDANACSSSTDFEAPDIRSNITANITSSDTILSCNIPSLTLLASSSYPNPLVYRWINSMGDTLGTTSQLNVDRPADYTLLLLDPANGCTFSTSQQITQDVDTLPLLATDTYVLNCLQDSVDLSVDIGNFVGEVEYTWRDTNGNLLGNTPVLANVDRPGSYLLEVLRTDNNCLSRMAVAVSEDRRLPNFEILQPRPLSCLVNPAPARAILEENGQYTFLWTSTNGQIEGSANQDSIFLSAVGTYRLLVTNTQNGCSQEGSFVAAEDRRLLLPDAGEDRLIPCDVNNFQVLGTASPALEGAGYRWLNENNEEVSNTALLNTLQPGRYTLLLTHPVSGCISSDALLLRSNGPQALPISPELSPCPEIGGVALVGEVQGGTPPYRYFLDGGEVTLINSRLGGLSEGFHAIRVEDANGCNLQDTFQILERLPFEGLAEDISIRLGQTVELGVRSNRDNEIVSYRWEGFSGLSCVQCPNPMAAPFESFRAFVELTDLAGCRLQLAQNVFVDQRNLVYAPTAFSPRKPDGFNDRFTLYGDDRFVVQINYLRIFDRWGAMLFERENFPISNESEGWDGYYRGQLLSSNTYVFVAEVQLWDGTKEIVKGSFHLIP